MKVIYYSNVYLNLNQQPGVKKKIQAQIKVMRNAGIEVYHACPSDDNEFVIVDGDNNVCQMASIKNIRGPQKDKVFNDCLYSFLLQHQDIKVVYVRNGNYSLQMHLFYRKLKNIGVRVILEIATYPLTQRYTNIRQSLHLHRFKIALSQIYTASLGSLGIPFLRHSIDKIVTFHGYDSIWGVKTIKITNAVDVNSIRKHLVNPIGACLRLITVANVAKWHGFDRIIEGLFNYYNKDNNEIEVTFDIIGPGDEIIELKELVSTYGLEDKVKFLGPKMGEELDDLFDNSDIAISVLGVHRDGMTKCDSLKSREYSARCIPFVTAQAEQMYSGLPFVFMVPNDDSPIDIDLLIDFAKECCTEETSSQMREYAIKECDWSRVFMPICDYIKDKY